MITSLDIAKELKKRSRQVDESLDSLRAAAVEYASAENEYRKGKAQAILAAEGTVQEKDALAEIQIGDLRARRDLASQLRDVEMEVVRARRGQLSAVQSVAAVVRAEMEFTRTGGDHRQ
jgi:hypothetical protein